ncbi:MAG: tetratricopeptide repeat protein, partial [Planctomycetota bacterium]
ELGRWAQRAADDASQALDASQPSAEVLNFAATVALSRGQNDRALEYAKKGIVEEPRAPTFYRLASLAAERQAAELARTARPTAQVRERLAMSRQLSDEFLDQGLERLPKSTELLWQRAMRFLDRGLSDEDALDSIVTRLRELQFSPAMVELLVAKQSAAQKRYGTAIKQFESARAGLTQNDALVRLIDLGLAECYEAIGNHEGQLSVLRRIASDSPNWLPIRERLANAYLQAGRVDDAVAEYSTVIAQPGSPISAPLNLARMSLLQNMGRDESARDWTLLENLLDKLDDNNDSAPESAVLRAEMQLARDDSAGAQLTLENAEATESVLSAKALLAINQNRLDDAAKVLGEARTLHGGTAKLRFAETSLILRRNSRRSDAAKPPPLDSIADQVAIDPSATLETNLSFAELVVPFLISYQEYAAARTLVDFQLKHRPGNVTAQARKLQVAFASRDETEMQSFLTWMREKGGDEVLSHYGTALSIAMRAEDGRPLTQAEHDRAQAELAIAVSLRPDAAYIAALSARLSDQIGETETAISKYKQAVLLGHADLRSVQRLVQLLNAAKRFSEADSVMRALRRSKQPFSAQMTRVASEISVRLSQLTRAIELAESAAEKTQLGDDYLWLASVHQLAGDSREAERAFQKALAASPKDPQVRLAWISFLCTESRLDQAAQILRAWESEHREGEESGDVESLLLIARGYALVGDRVGVRRMLAGLDRSKLDGTENREMYYQLISKFGDSGQGKDYLRTLLATTSSRGSGSSLPSSEPKTETGSAAVDDSGKRWARRQLALSMTQSKQVEARATGESRESQLQSAVSLLKRNLEERPGNIPDRYALAYVQSHFIGELSPEVSLRIFEELLADGWTPTTSDEFLMGRLHAANGNWLNGRRMMLPLLTHPELCQPIHLKTYARVLLKRGEHREASLWVDKLVSQGVLDADTAALLCEVRFRKGQWDDVLRELTEPPGDDASDSAWMVRAISLEKRFEILMNLATRLKDADLPETGSENPMQEFERASMAMAKELSSKGEFPAMFYVHELLRRGSLQAAIEALDQQSARASSAELVRFAETLLAEATCSPSDLANVESVYVKRVKSDPADNAMKIAVARIREMRGDHQSAIKIYQAILSSGTRNMAAENNLAALLALTDQDLEQAIFLCDESIKKFGERMFLLDTRGLCKLQSKRIDDAIVDFEQAYAMTPHPLVLFHLAWAADLSGNPAKSEYLFAKARSQGLKRSQVHVLERTTFDRLSQ